jgi:hypothetical protein
LNLISFAAPFGRDGNLFLQAPEALPVFRLRFRGLFALGAWSGCAHSGLRRYERDLVRIGWDNTGNKAQTFFTGGGRSFSFDEKSITMLPC